MNEEAVNHPDHYNRHPSGVETIEIARYLSFNLGNMLKYLMRRQYKGEEYEDVCKAVFYAEDEIGRASKSWYYIHTRSLFCRPLRHQFVAKKMRAVAYAEQNEGVKRVYLLFGSIAGRRDSKQIHTPGDKTACD